MKDVMGALRALVLSRPSIAALVDDRVYINAIPREVIEAEDTRHPRKMIVLRQAGGLAKADLLNVASYTVTALCYGEVDFEADRLQRTLTEELLFAGDEAHDGVYIHNVTTTGGPVALVDPDIVWPAVSQSYVVTAEAWETAHV